MKNSDKIAQILVENNIKDIFMVTGGAAMHLNDSLSRNANLNTTIFHHEQSCRCRWLLQSSGKVAICVTAGPGGINTLNGVFGAYGDSIPMLILSGQVRTETLNFDSNLRQLASGSTYSRNG